MPDLLASVIVVLAAAFLLGLGAVSLLLPAQGTRFLSGFATSARAHFLEMLIRLIVGVAFVSYASHMLAPTLFLVFGGVLVVTSLVLLLLPWRWHERFAQRFATPVIQRVWLIGLVALPLGGVILFAVLRGGTE